MVRFLSHFRRLWLVGVLALSSALGLGALFAGTASAHATYASSDPAAGAVLATAPTQVTVHFSQGVDPQGSSLVIYHTEAKNTYSFDADSKVVSTGETQFPLSDARTMTIAMQGDGNGIYAVVWKTRSADDGEEDNGVFFFGVGTGNVLGSAPATTPPVAANSASGGVDAWVPILVGILALLVGGGIGAWLARRMNAPGSGGQTPASPAPDAHPAGKS